MERGKSELTGQEKVANACWAVNLWGLVWTWFKWELLFDMSQRLSKNSNSVGHTSANWIPVLRITIVRTTNQRKISARGVQFALVCPTEFEFLLDRWNTLRIRMHIGPETWRFGLQMAGLRHQYIVCRFKYDSTLLQIYLKGRISNQFLISVYFWKFTSVYFALLVFPSTRNQVKTTHNDNKIQVKDNEVFHNFYFILKTFQTQTFQTHTFTL